MFMGGQTQQIIFSLKKIKEGLRRNNSRMDGRLPITAALLLLQRLISCLPLICKSSYEVLLFRAAFLLAFFGFLRIGEFARTANNQNQDFKLIADSDLRVSGSTLWLKIRYSKTDQQGVTSSLQIEGSSNPHLCPVLAISQYLSSRPLFHGPLFIHLGGEVLKSCQFSHILKEAIKLVGLSPSSFSSHSFRIGAATTAATSGFPDEMIKKFGRWKSSAFEIYIRPHNFILNRL